MDREVASQVIPDLLHFELIRGEPRFQQSMQAAFQTDWSKPGQFYPFSWREPYLKILIYWPKAWFSFIFDYELIKVWNVSISVIFCICKLCLRHILVWGCSQAGLPPRLKNKLDWYLPYYYCPINLQFLWGGVYSNTTGVACISQKTAIVITTCNYPWSNQNIRLALREMIKHSAVSAKALSEKEQANSTQEKAKSNNTQT